MDLFASQVSPYTVTCAVSQEQIEVGITEGPETKQNPNSEVAQKVAARLESNDHESKTWLYPVSSSKKTRGADKKGKQNKKWSSNAGLRGKDDDQKKKSLSSNKSFSRQNSVAKSVKGEATGTAVNVHGRKSKSEQRSPSETAYLHKLEQRSPEYFFEDDEYINKLENGDLSEDQEDDEETGTEDDDEDDEETQTQSEDDETGTGDEETTDYSNDDDKSETGSSTQVDHAESQCINPISGIRDQISEFSNLVGGGMRCGEQEKTDSDTDDREETTDDGSLDDSEDDDNENGTQKKIMDPKGKKNAVRIERKRSLFKNGLPVTIVLSSLGKQRKRNVKSPLASDENPKSEIAPANTIVAPAPTKSPPEADPVTRPSVDDKRDEDDVYRSSTSLWNIALPFEGHYGNVGSDPRPQDNGFNNNTGEELEKRTKTNSRLENSVPKRVREDSFVESFPMTRQARLMNMNSLVTGRKWQMKTSPKTMPTKSRAAPTTTTPNGWKSSINRDEDLVANSPLFGSMDLNDEMSSLNNSWNEDYYDFRKMYSKPTTVQSGNTTPVPQPRAINFVQSQGRTTNNNNNNQWLFGERNPHTTPYAQNTLVL